MDIENNAKSSLQQALEIAAQIIAGENAALMERIAQLEQRLESMNETMFAMQEQLQQLKQDMELKPERKEAVEDAVIEQDDIAVEQDHAVVEQNDIAIEQDHAVIEKDDIAVEQDDTFVIEEVSVGEDERGLQEENVDEDSASGSIPDSMVGLGVLPFANELMEKANEAAAGSDVFDLMARNEEENDGAPIILNEAARPDWYDWEVDYPASYVDDVYKAISFNDRYEFIKELFNISGDLGEAEVLFKDTLDDINEMENFKQIVEYIRRRFPQWDEQSDEVYRFYMAVRRKFNKQ